MELMEWFQMQKQLDQYIEMENHLENEDLFDRKVLALLVEIGELANETRCFKFWSKKGPSEQNIILEEFVDGVHFILSIGIELGFENRNIFLHKQNNKEDLNSLFLRVYERIIKLKGTKSEEDFTMLLQDFFQLGMNLGFSIEDVQQAYIAKNEINYKRQKQGY
ncbi:dUTP diphosphatase [Bacillus sp. FJAT-49736]|nr:dUTP diphosphatase [Bacillus sp. FJAT-49736]